MENGGATLVGNFAAVIVFLAALAPFILSLMARSAISIAVSLTLLMLSGVFVLGPTLAHQAFAALAYVAALISASIIYIGYNIEQSIKNLSHIVGRTSSLRISEDPPERSRVNLPSASPAASPDSDWAKIKSEVPAARP